MSADSHVTSRSRRFNALVRAGQAAYRRSERRLAHDYWREAATLDPYNEKIWLRLYRVLDADEDRAVCLQNIIAINPTNVQARRRLNTLRQHTIRHTAAPVRTRRVRLTRVVIIGTAAGVLGGILASILVYGR